MHNFAQFIIVINTFINENQQQHFNIYITVYYIYHRDFRFFFLEIFKNTPDKHRYFYYYIIIFLVNNIIIIY